MVTGSAVTVIGAAVTVTGEAVTVETAVTVWLTGMQVGHVVAIGVVVVVTLRASRNWKGLAAAS